MKTSVDDAPADRGRAQGWDERVLVWNGTVARIPPPAIQPDAAQPVTGVEARNVTSKRRARGRK